MYDIYRSSVLLEGEKSASFSVEQGVVQGSSLSFAILHDLLKKVERAIIGIQLSNGKKVGGLLFADDFVGVCNSAESLQSLIDTVFPWHCIISGANVSKSAVMVFSKALIL